MRVSPDDEVWRTRTVWLGPTGWTFPWTARYLAYAVWLASFAAILLAEAATPLHVVSLLIWDLTGATLATCGLMSLVDYERPLSSVLDLAKVEFSTPRTPRSTSTVLKSHPKVVAR
jgi:hypothetical protein